MTKYSDTQPEKHTTDYRGTEIEPGKPVAYNRSGDVVLGTIVNLQRNEWVSRGRRLWRLMFELTVEDEEGKQSAIRNPRCFVIMEQV